MNPAKSMPREISIEMMRRISMSARETEKAKYRDDRLNMVLYNRYGNGMYGVFWIYRDEEGLWLRMANAEWWLPSRPLHKDTAHLLERRMTSPHTILVIYLGVRTAAYEWVPNPGDDLEWYEHEMDVINERTAFCQRMDTFPDAATMSGLIEDFFGIAHKFKLNERAPVTDLSRTSLVDCLIQSCARPWSWVKDTVMLLRSSTQPSENDGRATPPTQTWMDGMPVVVPIDRNPVQRTTPGSISYDVSTEIARRIVSEALEMEQEQKRRLRTNLLLYEQVDDPHPDSDIDDCRFGRFWLYADENGLWLRTQHDTEGCGVNGNWYEPIRLTDKNARTLLSRYLPSTPTVIVAYEGDEEAPSTIVVNVDGTLDFDRDADVWQKKMILLQTLSRRPAFSSLCGILRSFFS